MNNSTTWNEKLFASRLDSCYSWYMCNDGIGYFAFNSFLYLKTLREKYIKMYEEFIHQLNMHAKAIGILLKGYLPIFYHHENYKKF